MSIAISRCGDEPWHHKELAEHCLSLTTDCLGGVRGSIQMIIQLYIFLSFICTRRLGITYIHIMAEAREAE